MSPTRDDLGCILNDDDLEAHVDGSRYHVRTLGSHGGAITFQEAFDGSKWRRVAPQRIAFDDGTFGDKLVWV